MENLLFGGFVIFAASFINSFAKKVDSSKKNYELIKFVIRAISLITTIAGYAFVNLHLATIPQVFLNPVWLCLPLGLLTLANFVLDSQKIARFFAMILIIMITWLHIFEPVSNSVGSYIEDRTEDGHTLQYFKKNGYVCSVNPAYTIYPDTKYQVLEKRPVLWGGYFDFTEVKIQPYTYAAMDPFCKLTKKGERDYFYDKNYDIVITKIYK